MARLFGEFLVKQNLASTSQVLEALMIQIRDMPTYAEVCYEKGLIPEDQLLKVLASQQRTGRDFRSAAEDAGVWSENVAESISRFLRARHKPIGEILIDLGHLTLDTLTLALDQYVEELAAEGKMTKSLAQTAGGLEPDLVCQFASAYASGFRPALEKILESAEKGEATHAGILDLTRRLIAEVSGIKGAAEFLGAASLSDVSARILATLNAALESRSYAHFTELRDIAKMSFHVFEGCAQSIGEFGTDDVFSFDPNIDDLRDRLFGELLRLETKLGLGSRTG